MSIEKKSLISTLKTTKKANVAKDEIDSATTASPTVKSPSIRLAASKKASAKALTVRHSLSKK